MDSKRWCTNSSFLSTRKQNKRRAWTHVWSKITCTFISPNRLKCGDLQRAGILHPVKAITKAKSRVLPKTHNWMPAPWWNRQHKTSNRKEISGAHNQLPAQAHCFYESTSISNKGWCKIHHNKTAWAKCSCDEVGIKSQWTGEAQVPNWCAAVLFWLIAVWHSPNGGWFHRTQQNCWWHHFQIPFQSIIHELPGRCQTVVWLGQFWLSQWS